MIKKLCAVNAIRNIPIDEFTGSGIMLTNNEAKDNIPANSRLDEDILKTSCRRLSSSSSEDILIKTNLFA